MKCRDVQIGLLSVLLLAGCGWAQSAQEQGPNPAPENERTIRRSPRPQTSSSPASLDCARSLSASDCASGPAQLPLPKPAQSAEEAPPDSSDASSGQPGSGQSGSGLPGTEFPGELAGELEDMPRSPEATSSSRETKIDFDRSRAAGDVSELQPFDPHKAAKDIEVGEYYMKRKNYRAAVSRFRGALKFKPNDALATIRLAEALEKSWFATPEKYRQRQSLDEAAKYYSLYLDILPNGDYAIEAKAALERLDAAEQAAAAPSR